jgi:hypothetical protein
MRLTLDIDGREREWWAWAVYYQLRDSGQFTRVEIYRTRKGYHIIAYGGGLDLIEMEKLRRHYGDDNFRLEVDVVKHPKQPRNVLWDIKNGYEVKLLESMDIKR